jgi:hypothetical protein
VADAARRRRSAAIRTGELDPLLATWTVCYAGGSPLPWEPSSVPLPIFNYPWSVNFGYAEGGVGMRTSVDHLVATRAESDRSGRVGHGLPVVYANEAEQASKQTPQCLSHLVPNWSDASTLCLYL